MAELIGEETAPRAALDGEAAGPQETSIGLTTSSSDNAHFATPEVTLRSIVFSAQAFADG